MAASKVARSIIHLLAHYILLDNRHHRTLLKMLPSKLFRNTGIPPALRSLITPHASLPSTIAVQMRFRLGVIPGTMVNGQGALGTKAPFSTSLPQSNASVKVTPRPSTSTPSSSATTDATATSDDSVATTTSQALPEKMEPKLSLTFTCTVPDCGHRSTHQFTKRAYQKGIVIVQCPGCKNRHLIADHLGWFEDSTGEGKLRTIEDIMRAKGESVRRGITNENGDIEFAEP